MRLKLLLLTTFISCFLFSQAQNESIPLVYDTSGYLENNQPGGGIVGVPIGGGDTEAPKVIPTVNAEMNVNEVGGLTYMLPIELLKGINNFQPNVSLAYNSQGGNGQAGWGWNVVGLSVISRGGKSKEIDGITIGPQFDNSDPFYLDGQRLININGTDYATEKFSKIKIQKQSTGDYSFIVKYTDGRIAKYKELVSGEHYISIISDAFNNEIHYSYNVAGNIPVLDKISYGGTSASNDKFFVNFFYKDKLNAIKIYRNGNEYINSKVIDYITSSSSYTGIYRTYQLAYDYIENSSAERLRIITVSNESGETLKPLNFKYNSPTSTGQILPSSKTVVNIPTTTTGLGNVALGDFYGTGEVEPVYQAKLKNGTFPTFSNKGTVNISNVDSSSDYYSGKVLFNNKVTKNDAIITTSITYPGDANIASTILTDVVTFHMENLGTGEKRDVQVTLPGGRLNVAPIVNTSSYTITYPDKRDREGRTFQTGDFNNDGLFDVLILEKESIGRNANVYLLELGKIQTATATPITISNANILIYKKAIYPIELDGDGLPELLTTTAGNNNYSIYKLDLPNNNLVIITNQGSFDNYSDDTPLFLGDFNGDGLTDFIYPQKVYKMSESDSPLTDQFHQIENDQLYWWKYISNGKDFIKIQENYTPQKLAYIASTQKNIIKRYSFWEKLWSGKMDEYTHTEYSTNSIMVTDFNGDGRSDIIRVNKIGKIKYSTTEYIKDANVQNQDVAYTYMGNTNCHYSSNWPYIYGCDMITAPSAIANKIAFIPNISAKNGSTFAETNIQSVSIGSKIISPFTLIYLSTDANQLSSFKTNIVFRDVLSGTQDSYSINNDGFLEKQMQEVDNGSGVVQKIEYRPMVANYSTSEVPYLYNKEQANTFSYPVYIHSTNAGFYLAHKIHTEFDDKILTKEYRFENGVQNLEGKGFLGFQKTYISDAYQSEIKNGKYINKNPLRAVFWTIQTKDPLKENAVLTSSYGGLNDFLTLNRIKNEKFDRGNHQYLILSTEEESIDYLKKITINKRYDYDINDDLKLKIAYTDYNGVSSSKATYTYKPESTDGDHYFYGKIAGIEQTSYKDNLSFTTREENDYFSHGNLQENRKYNNNANAPPIVTNSTYDPVGNVIAQTLSTAGITSQTTTYEYDITNRYVNKTTTPDGLSSSSVVNALGRVSEETSSLGLKTYYKYDSWGNITEITDFLGKKTTINKSVTSSPTGAAYSLTKRREGGALTLVTFDKFDREIQYKTQSINSKWISVRTEYDIFGRTTGNSEPFFDGETPKWNTIEYDDLSRPIRNISFVGKVVTTCYEGMKVTVDDTYKKTSKTLDATGNTVRAQDHGGVIGYSYYPNGALKETNYEGIKTTFEIDDWGNKKKINDPSAGTFTYEYDNLSRITKEITPKGYTLYTYDSLGRPQTEKTYGNSTAENTNIEKTYTYNANTKLPENITGTSNGKQFVYTTYYDSYYRIKGKKEQTPDFTYISNTTFDNYGRADVVSISTTLSNPNYTTSSSIKNVYDGIGNLIQQNDDATGTMVWHISEANAMGKTTQMEYGNGYTITNNYNAANNSLTEIRNVQNSTGISIVDIGYDYDVDKGVLKSRDNRTFGKNEKYSYDKLNRLLNETVNDILVNEYTYDQRGRITSNTELGKYNYEADNYKLKNINFNTNGQNVNTQRGFASVTYNAYRSPLQITLAGKDDLSFDYNILKTRYAMTSSVTGKQKLYSSDFTIEITKQGNKTEIITFITGDPYTANYIKKETLVNGIVSESGNYYLHRDNMGSILAITKATDGTIVEKRYFDAWGNLKAMTNAAGQLITNNPQMQFMDRGYTGHEHLQSVGLINMNARIYDPILRKFLSADNLVSDSYNTQAYDRYSYVLNNPLLYIDLDGNELITLAAIGIAAAIGAAVGIFSKMIINMISGIPFWYGLGKAATTGAISGAISFGIGSAASSMAASFIGKAALQAGMHGISGGLMSSVDGGKFISGFLSGAISSIISTGIQALGTNFTGNGALQDANRNYISMNSFGSGDLIKATMLVAGGLSGGISSAIAGGKFMNGFKQGLMTSGLNHLAHMFIVSESQEDKTIRKTFRTFMKEGKHCEALEYITGAYKLNQGVEKLYNFQYEESDWDGMTTEHFDTMSLITVTSKIASGYFGSFVRALNHEFVHVFQVQVLHIENHEFREFLAHQDSVTNAFLPKSEWKDNQYWIERMNYYWTKMPLQLQKSYLLNMALSLTLNR